MLLHKFEEFNGANEVETVFSITHFSLPEEPDPAGLRLRKAFNHLVFIDDEDDDDILRSPGLGEPGSSLLKKSSF